MQVHPADVCVGMSISLPPRLSGPPLSPGVVPIADAVVTTLFF